MKLKDNEVDLWYADINHFPVKPDAYSDLLTEDERQKSERYKFKEDQRLNILARSALRILSAKYLKTSPTSIKMGYGEFDKPYFPDHPDFKFNVSHSGEFIVLGFVKNLEIGVDVERIKADFDVLEIADNFFSPQEVDLLRAVDKNLRYEAFYECWTRKESFIKAKGSGLSFPLVDFAVSIGPSAELLATNWNPGERGEWTLGSFKPKKGYVGALAVHGNVERINYRIWKGIS